MLFDLIEIIKTFKCRIRAANSTAAALRKASRRISHQHGNSELLYERKMGTSHPLLARSRHWGEILRTLTAIDPNKSALCSTTNIPSPDLTRLKVLSQHRASSLEEW